MDPWLTCYGCILTKIPKYHKPDPIFTDIIFKPKHDPVFRISVPYFRISSE
jgi:hypothetical protein